MPGPESCRAASTRFSPKAEILRTTPLKSLLSHGMKTLAGGDIEESEMSNDVGLRVAGGVLVGASVAFRSCYHLGAEKAEIAANVAMVAMIVCLLLIRRRERRHQACSSAPFDWPVGFPSQTRS